MDGMSIREWFHSWEGHIRTADFEGARELFDPAVVGFGTVVPVVHGLEGLEIAQWRSVWGKISNFTFHLDELTSGTSGDDLTGWGACPWSSTGHDKDGTEFPRPGRATVILARDDAGGPWRGVHTHFSLEPDQT